MANSTRLYRTNTAATLGTKCTMSTWFKPGVANDGDETDNYLAQARVGASGGDYWNWYIVISAGVNNDRIYLGGSQDGVALTLYTDMLFRDPNAWYHMVAVWDSTEAETDRVKMYVNGNRLTDWRSGSSQDYPTASLVCPFNETGFEMDVGGRTGNNGFCDGYLAQTVLVDGQALAASDFGSTDATTGEWKPKSDGEIRTAVGAFGNNGFLLSYENSSYLGYDYQTSDRSGTTNDLTVVGPGFQSQDNPSNNWCTLDMLGPSQSNSAGSLTMGNNYVQCSSDSTWRSTYGTFANYKGKYYFEAEVTAIGGGTYIGVIDTEQHTANNQNFKENSRAYSYKNDGEKFNNDVGATYGDSYTTADIIGCALDLTNGAIWFSKNGVWQNSATIGEIGAGTTTNAAYAAITLSELYLYGPAISGKTNTKLKMNFGNGYFGTTVITSAGTNASGIGQFEYDVPTNFTAWSTKGFNE